MSPSKKWKRRSGQQVGDAICLHVHAVDLPVGRRDDALGEVMADEAVDTEDQYSWHGSVVVGPGARPILPGTAAAWAARHGAKARGPTIAPSISSSSTCRVPPPPQRTMMRPSATSKRGAAASRRRCVQHARAQQPRRMTVDAGARARVGRGDGAHQVVDRCRALRPVDDAVVRLAAAEIRAAREVLARSAARCRR